jgi:hypothetical protein
LEGNPHPSRRLSTERFDLDLVGLFGTECNQSPANPVRDRLTERARERAFDDRPGRHPKVEEPPPRQPMASERDDAALRSRFER